MAIAFDAYTKGTGTADPVSFSHAAASSGVKGVVVLILAIVAGDQVTSITYGGTSMSEVAGSPVLHATGELGDAHGWFLGSSVPQGTQTVSVTRLSTTNLHVHCFTVTGSADTEVADTDTINSDSQADPALSLVTPAGVSTFIAGALFSGQNDPAGVGTGTDYTQVDEFDFGTKVGNVQRRTSIATGGTITCDWTQLAEDAVGIAVAVREVASGDATVTPAVIACSTTLPQAGVGVGVAPAVAAAMATLPQPAVSVGAAPAVLAAVAALPQPAVAAGAAPVVIAAVVALPAPTSVGQSGDAQATPAVIAVVMAVPAATVAIGAAPAALATMVALPQPGISIAAAPVAVAITAALPQPAVSVGISPATVTAVAALPQAGVGVGAAPAMIAALVALALATAGQSSGATVTPAVITVVVALPPVVSAGGPVVLRWESAGGQASVVHEHAGGHAAIRESAGGQASVVHEGVGV